MQDLRKKTLVESGKKASRKARGSAAPTPNTSPGNSRPGSRPASRPASRYASENDETSDSDLDDVMTASTNSVSELDTPESWEEKLRGRITELLASGKRNGASRTTVLGDYAHHLRYHPADSVVSKSMASILPSLVRSIRSANSDEQILSMKALAVTALTSPSDDVYETAFPILKQVCEDSEEEAVKVQALSTMGVVVVYGGGEEQDMDEFLEFLTYIAESDGHRIGAPDSGIVVTTAMKVWAFVATNLDNPSSHNEEALDAFVEQLESTDANVRSSAGINIALLFEVSRELEEEGNGRSLNLSVDPKYLVKRMRELSKGSKSISKKGRTQVRNDLASVITSIELGKGPGWSATNRPVSNPHTGGSKEVDQGDEVEELGYREKLRINKDEIYVIESWATKVRIELLQDVLKGGFSAHFSGNEVVRETLGDLEPFPDS
ncbi:hypothetical protein RB595_002987 [Gaeumannomyces hyphopodioides]